MMLSTQTKIDSYFSSTPSVNKKVSIYKSSHNLPPCPSQAEISTMGGRQRDDDLMKSPSKRRRKVSYNFSVMTPGKSSDKNIPQIQSLVKKSNPSQMYLDLGQESFGRQEICPACGMLSVHGLQEDTKQHEKICRPYKHGVPFQNKNARVVARINGGIVVEIRSNDSPELRQKVLLVEQIVDSELGFVNSNRSSPRTAYLFVRDRRVLGMAMAESISHAFSLNSSFEKESKARQAFIGIYKIWVHETCRKQGIASLLVDTIRSKLIYGFIVPVNFIAFSSPSVSGLEFARQYSMKAMASTYPSVLVYDY